MAISALSTGSAGPRGHRARAWATAASAAALAIGVLVSGTGNALADPTPTGQPHHSTPLHHKHPDCWVCID